MSEHVHAQAIAREIVANAASTAAGRRRVGGEPQRVVFGPVGILALQRSAGNAAVGALMAAKLRSPGEQALTDIYVADEEFRRDESDVEKGRKAAKAAGVPVDLEGTKAPATAPTVTNTGFGPESVAPKTRTKPMPAAALGKAVKAIGKPGGPAGTNPAGPGKGPAAPASGAGAAAPPTGEAALSGDILLQPPVTPTADRPQDDPTFNQVKGGTNSKAHPTASSKSNEAQSAALPPTDDGSGQAKAAKIDAVDAQMALQRTVGNAAVTRVIQRHPPQTSETYEGINHSPENLFTGGHGNSSSLGNIVRMAFSEEMDATDVDRNWVTSPVFTAWYLRGFEGVLALEAQEGHPSAGRPWLISGGPLNELIARNTRRGRQMSETMVTAMMAGLEAMGQRAAMRRPPRPSDFGPSRPIPASAPGAVPAPGAAPSAGSTPATAPPTASGLRVRTNIRAGSNNQGSSGGNQQTRPAATTRSPDEPEVTAPPTATAGQLPASSAPQASTPPGPYETNREFIRGIRRARATPTPEREEVHEARRLNAAVRRTRLQQAETQAQAEVEAELRAAAAAQRVPQRHRDLERGTAAPGAAAPTMSQAERDVRVGQRLQRNADRESRSILAGDMIGRGQALVRRSTRRFVSESVQRAENEAREGLTTTEGGQHNAQGRPAGNSLERAADDTGLPPAVQDELERRGGQLISGAGSAQHPGGRRGRR